MPERNKKSISLIMPVYNEMALLGRALKTSKDALAECFEDFEIILVDDGSKDDTGRIMEEFASVDSRVKVLHNYINLNIGVSIQRGFATSSKDYLFFNSVDLPLNPCDIKGIFENNDDFDILVLERKSYQGASFWRKFTSRINRLLLHCLFPIATFALKDLNFTFICRREILPSIMPLAKSPAFTQAEMILRARYQELRVKPIPVEYHARTSGRGALGGFHDMLWTLYDMFRFRLITWKTKTGL